jgi:hypothetical protein
MSSSSSMMKDSFARLRFDKKIKEGAVTGPDYKDAKAYQQAYKEIMAKAARKRAAYEAALVAFNPDPKRLKVLDATKLGDSILQPLGIAKGEQWIMLKVSSLDRMDEMYSSLHNAIMAREGIKRMDLAPSIIEELKDFEDNEATKNGVEAVKTAIQENDALLALVLSTAKDDDKDTE